MPAAPTRTTARYGWPPWVVEDAGHFMVVERPQAFLEALRAALGTA
jgi:pimeloyl-ACP methyl ester carboxylesterase